MPIANPFFFLNQVATTVRMSVKGLSMRLGITRLHTLGAGHEEASHAETSYQSLGQPDQTVVAFAIAATADRNAEQELSKDHEY